MIDNPEISVAETQNTDNITVSTVSTPDDRFADQSGGAQVGEPTRPSLGSKDPFIESKNISRHDIIMIDDDKDANVGKKPELASAAVATEIVNIEDDTSSNGEEEEVHINTKTSSRPGSVNRKNVGGGQEVEEEDVLETDPDSILLSIPLNDPFEQKTLVINYPSLLALHIEKTKKLATGPGIVESNLKSSNQYATVKSDSVQMPPEPEAETAAAQKKRTRKKKLDAEDEYNVDDGWIDDSEAVPEGNVAGEAPAWEYGWFAWKGDVNALFRGGNKGKVCDETPVVSTAQAVVEKVKQKKVMALASGTGSPTSKKKKGAVAGAVDGSENEETNGAPSESVPATSAKKASKKAVTASKSGDGKSATNKTGSVKRSSKPSGNGTETVSGATHKPKKNPVRGEPVIEYKPIGLPPMPLPVIKELDRLQKEAKKCDFTVKKNFPPSLKPIFSDCVTAAMDHQVLNTNFWSHITSLLPYNSFTMKKLASRQVYPERMLKLNQEIPVAYKDFESELARALEEQSKDMKDGGKKFRFDDKLRIIFWNILCLEWEIAEMDNDLKRLDKQEPSFIELAVRKAVYSKMASYWPAGTMETSILSNQYSQFKKKREKTEDEHGFQYPEATSLGYIRVDPYARIVPKPRMKKEDTIVILDSPEKGANSGNASGGGEGKRKADVAVSEDAGSHTKKSKVEV